MAVNDLKPLSTPFTRASACICLTRIPMARRYDVISPMWAVLIDIELVESPDDIREGRRYGGHQRDRDLRQEPDQVR